jgi:hypothetical protein
MSSIFDAKESFLASTRMNDKPAKEDLQKYSFPWIKWMVDKLFPARTLKLEGDRGAALSPRR